MAANDAGGIAGCIGEKRLRDTAGPPHEPRAKYVRGDDSLEAKFKLVEDTLNHAPGISDACREMLRLATRKSLGCPAPARHRFQQVVAEMVCDVIECTENGLRKDVAEAKLKQDEATDELRVRKEEITAAQTSHLEQQRELETAEARFCDDNCDLQEAWDAYDAASRAYATVDRENAEAQECAKLLDSLFGEPQLPLVERQFTETEISRMLRLLSQMPHDDSLAQALPVVTRKSIGSRTAFDRLVMAQLETQLQKHRGTVLENAAQLKRSAADRADALAQANLALNGARERQQLSAAALRSLDVKVREAETVVADAEGAVLTVEEKRRNAVILIACAENDLGEFEGGPSAAVRALSVWEEPADAGSAGIVLPFKDISEKDGSTLGGALAPGAMSGVPTPLRALSAS